MKEKDIPIYELAPKLNISPATVGPGLNDRGAINKGTQKKIFDLPKEMGYRSNNFASSLRTQRTNTIGVIVPRLNSNFTSTALAGTENVADRQGYNLVISQSLESFKKEVTNAETMLNKPVDGLLVSLAYNTENIEHMEPFLKKNIPIIFFGGVAEHQNCRNVLIDNRKAAFDATTHLINQGCKKIVHVTAMPKASVYV
jgi:LacI family transcriptional regulator